MDYIDICGMFCFEKEKQVFLGSCFTRGIINEKISIDCHVGDLCPGSPSATFEPDCLLDNKR